MSSGGAADGEAEVEMGGGGTLQCAGESEQTTDYSLVLEAIPLDSHLEDHRQHRIEYIVQIIKAD